MKFTSFAFLLVAITCLSAVSATWQQVCGSNVCGVGQVCVCRDGVSNCVLLDQCHDIAIVQTIERTWEENGVPFTLYRVHVVNYAPMTLQQIVIETDCTLNPRDNNSVWNIIYDHGYFLLPQYAQGIKPGQTFTFGYIDHGRVAPNLFIKALTY
ncbi:hypothetical protein PPL_08917 [Heterostelium album PN500]|uniref:Carbohydrate binding domain-containing protein n=1 Tax=Heterostelium pallidum (strain ATCC 26659 / Pp 5 / PN500) TaxID=670386 RepID=D3BK36_HETP5|nr:hypothetical protein PPL_08917 [Heterostelium album PN500]EFA78266.1 hypothetical protein PPL_08917 [Heterostelium album PN500]|eukprot:XP_020430391.1 hypothetical protein PPL_08917 [Heterostelium album PN500]